MKDIDLVKLKESILNQPKTDMKNSVILALIEQLEAVQSERNALLASQEHEDNCMIDAVASRDEWRLKAMTAEAELERRDAIFPPIYPDRDEMNRLTDIFTDTVKINFESGFVDNAELVITAIVNHWESSRRDAAAGEPIYQLIDDSNWYDCEKYLYDEALTRGDKCRIVYTSAQPAALPPEMPPEELLPKGNSTDACIRRGSVVNGWKYCREAAKALGCQPVPVVKLPARFKPKVSSLLGNHAAVMQCTPDGGWVNLNVMKSALEAAGVRYETEE